MNKFFEQALSYLGNRGWGLYEREILKDKISEISDGRAYNVRPLKGDYFKKPKIFIGGSLISTKHHIVFDSVEFYFNDNLIYFIDEVGSWIHTATLEQFFGAIETLEDLTVQKSITMDEGEKSVVKAKELADHTNEDGHTKLTFRPLHGKWFYCNQTGEHTKNPNRYRRTHRSVQSILVR